MRVRPWATRRHVALSPSCQCQWVGPHISSLLGPINEWPRLGFCLFVLWIKPSALHPQLHTSNVKPALHVPSGSGSHFPAITMHPCDHSSIDACFVLGQRELWPVLSSLTHVSVCDFMTGSWFLILKDLRACLWISPPSWLGYVFFSSFPAEWRQEWRKQQG